MFWIDFLDYARCQNAYAELYLIMVIISLLFYARYPNPSAFTYERRLFCPFEYALQPPPWYKEDHIAVKKPELPHGISELKQYDGPQCYVIPGNHGLLPFSV